MPVSLFVPNSLNCFTMSAQLSTPTSTPSTRLPMPMPQHLEALPEIPSRLRVARRQIIAGGSAGFVEVCCMHPLDVVKTRLQIQSSTAVDRYASVTDCFKRMYRSEGPLSFYKGILPPILAETPKRAVKFFGFEQYKNILTDNGRMPATPVVLTGAGIACGLTEALVINPFEVVKVSLQAQRGNHKSRTTTMQMAVGVFRTGGLGKNGLYRGVTSTLGRHGVWNGVYFGLYHSLRPHVLSVDKGTQNLVAKLSLGLLAGTLASVTNIPFDVAKSRIQGPQPQEGVVKYKTCFQTMRLIQCEEGARALYTGLVPKVMRLGPGGAIMLVVYETVSDWLQLNGM